MEPATSFDPAELSPVDTYKLLTGLVTPRPIGWIGTVSEDGERNLAPYSFFNAVCADPPTVLFSAGRPGRLKDTLANSLRVGEFTVNIVDEAMAEAMNLTAGEYEPGVDEFELAGVTPIVGDEVRAPMVAESPARFECVVTQYVDLGPVGDEPVNTVVFGEVKAMHVADRVLDGTRTRPEELAAVGRLAGANYARTAGSLFAMVRP